jgi:hypothetical protein
MTGSSGSSSFDARSTPKPSPSVNRRSDRTTAGGVVRSAASASRWSRASMTLWPCPSSAWRSMTRSESLSSTSRIGAAAARARAPGTRPCSPLNPAAAPRSGREGASRIGRTLNEASQEVRRRDGLLLRNL